MPFDELPDCFGGGVVDAGEGDVRVIEPFFGFNADIEKGIFDFFLQLEEMGMAVGEASPDGVGLSAGREKADSFNGEQEGAHLDRFERLLDAVLILTGEVADKFKGQVITLRVDPMEAAQPVFHEPLKGIADIIRQVDGEEKTLTPEVGLTGGRRCIGHGSGSDRE